MIIFKYYQNGSSCKKENNYCWKYFNPYRSEISSVGESKFAKSSDWSIQKTKVF